MVEDGSVARATIVSSESCSRAMLLALPEYCAWPEGARRTMILERNVVIIAHVEEDGKPVGVRILGNAGDPEIDAAITECAMHGRYRPASDHTESLTCPVRIRLARFPTDLGGRTASLP